MAKTLKIHNPHTRTDIIVPPSFMRRCDRCERVMMPYRSWWARQSEVHITWLCQHGHDAHTKTVIATVSRTGVLK
jgi:RNase P subunit RPR2